MFTKSFSFLLFYKEKYVFYYSTILFALTLPLSRAAVSFFIIWFLLLFIIRRDYAYTWKYIKQNRVFHAMGSLFGLLLLSILWSENTSEALNQIRLYSYWIIIPILASNLKKEWIPNIITAFLLGMFISEVIAYGIFFEWWTFKGRSPEYPSPFMFHIHYSIFLATTSMILFSRLLSNQYSLQSKFPMALFFLTSTGNLMISTGRTGQLAFLVAMAVAIIIHYRLTIRSLILFTGLTMTLFMGAYFNINLFQKRIDQGINDVQQLQLGNFDTSWGLRAAFWIITVDIVKKHPMLGVGIGDYKQASIEALKTDDHSFSPYTINWCSNYDYHNQYLMILGQIGLIGFALMVWLYTELFRLVIRNLDNRLMTSGSISIFFL